MFVEFHLSSHIMQLKGTIHRFVHVIVYLSFSNIYIIAWFRVTNHLYHGFPSKTVKQSQA
jgi:hypothetical protein